MNTRGNGQVENGHSHAVVLGGSLAGLLAARILADHFDEVTVIERDAYTETTAARKGIPQANHVHGLLVRGRQILEELFPGVQDEMIAAGAPGPRGPTRDALHSRPQSPATGLQHVGAADRTLPPKGLIPRAAGRRQ